MAWNELFAQAPLYTSVYDRKKTLQSFSRVDVRTSFLQRWPWSTNLMHKFALPMYPSAFEALDLSAYDVVLSSSSSFAKGVITRPETCHICYCHTPARFAWRQHEYLAQSRIAKLLSPFLRKTLQDLRVWDLASAQRVDYFIANSHNIARRIRKYYGRTAFVIPPPVEVSRFKPAPGQVGNHFLVVSRLVGYKRIDIAIEACNKLHAPLKIIGSGPELKSLKKIAGPTVEFLGRLPDEEVAAHLAKCQALIFPGEEDFGITPLEAMASGRPVVAYKAGGALETVVQGKTGLLFNEQTADSLAQALVECARLRFEPDLLRSYTMPFDIAVYKTRLSQFIESAVAEHDSNYSIDWQSPQVPQFGLRLFPGAAQQRINEHDHLLAATDS